MHSFECFVIKQEVEIEGNLSQIYGDKITKETAQTVTKILNLRKKILEKME